MNKVLFIAECEIDLDGLALRMHCTVDEVKARLHRNPEAMAREISKNPTYFKFFGDVDIDDVSEPLVLGKLVKEIGEKLDRLLSSGTQVSGS